MPRARSHTREQARFLRVDQVAAILRCSTDSIYRYIREGVLPAVQLGGQKGNALRIPARDLGKRLIDWGDSWRPIRAYLTEEEKAELREYAQRLGRRR